MLNNINSTQQVIELFNSKLKSKYHISDLYLNVEKSHTNYHTQGIWYEFTPNSKYQINVLNKMLKLTKLATYYFDKETSVHSIILEPKVYDNLWFNVGCISEILDIIKLNLSINTLYYNYDKLIPIKTEAEQSVLYKLITIGNLVDINSIILDGWLSNQNFQDRLNLKVETFATYANFLSEIQELYDKTLFNLLAKGFIRNYRGTAYINSYNRLFYYDKIIK